MTPIELKLTADVKELRIAMAQARGDVDALGDTAKASGAKAALGLQATTTAAIQTAAAAQQTKGAFDNVKNAGDVLGVVMDKIRAGDLRGAFAAGAQGAGILAGAMRTLGAALLTNPITLAITAIGALGAALYNAVGKAGNAQDQFVTIADHLDKLATQTGIAATELQTYSIVADVSNTSIDAVGQSLGFMQRQLAGVGDDPSNNMLERLGVTSTDTSEALLQTAIAIENLGSDAEKTAARMGVFGRGGNEVAGFLSKIAQLGPDAASALKGLVKTQSASALATAAQIEALQKLGNAIEQGKTNELAAATIDARKESELASVAYSSLGGMVTSWKELTIAASNAWSGFKTRSIEYMVEMRGNWADLCGFFQGAWDVSTNKIKGAFYSFSAVVNSGLSTLRQAMGDTQAAARFAEEAANARLEAGVAAAAVTSGSLKVIAAINGAGKAEAKARYDKAKLLAQKLTEDAKPTQPPTGKLGAKKDDQGDKQAKDAAKAIADAQYQLTKAQLEGEQKLLDDALKTAQDAYDTAYKDGLVGLEGYYTAREAIERQRLEGAIKLRQSELSAANENLAVANKSGNLADQLKAQKDVATVKVDLELAENALAKLPNQIATARTKDAELLKSLTLKVDVELAQLKGVLLPREAMLAQLREQYKDLIDKFRLDPVMTAKLETILAVKLDTQDYAQQLKDLELKQRQQSQPLELKAANVQAQQQNGTLSAPRAAAQLDVIKTEQIAQTSAYITQLQTLRGTLDQGEQSADKLQQKLDMDAKLNTLSINLANLKAPVVDLSVTFENSLQNGLEGAFNSMIDGTKSAKQAFGDMAKAIVADITKMIVKMLIMKALKAAFGGGFADGGAVIAPGATTRDDAQGFATGGSVHGAGGPRDDVIPAWLSHGEHVIDARTVQALGGHGVFNALRALGNGRATSSAMDKVQSVLGNIGASVAAAAVPSNPRGFAFADGGAVAAPTPSASSSQPMSLVQHFHFASESDPRSRSQASAAAFAGAQRALQRNG